MARKAETKYRCTHEGCSSTFFTERSRDNHVGLPHFPCRFCGRNFITRGMNPHVTRWHQAELAALVQPGQVYKHFQGGLYRVLHIGRRMTATGQNEQVGEVVVVYMALYDHDVYGPSAIWVRSVNNFLEVVTDDNRVIPRFDLVKSAPG